MWSEDDWASGCCGQCDCNGKLERSTLNLIFAAVSGVFFASAWWLFIDSIAKYPGELEECPYLIMPGLVSSAAFCMINFWVKLAWAAYYRNAYLNSRATCVFKSLFGFVFFVIFSMISLAILLYLVRYQMAKPKPKHMWPYLQPIFQTFLLATATFLYCFGVAVFD